MADPLTGMPPRFLRTPEAARFLGLSGRTLEKHRTYGTGPKYRKIGGRVVYALDDLKAWADLGAKTSTSDPGAGTVLPAKRWPGFSIDPNRSESGAATQSKAPKDSQRQHSSGPQRGAPRRGGTA
jgi:predicted DNA-binding transcriptional regulator AlpA